MSTESPRNRSRRDDLSSPSEAPLSGREMRYRTLFGAMDEGFCVLDMVFDETGNPVDYHFLEFNDAFERMTGITAEAALAGKTAREIYPTLEQFWFDTYGRVATTGVSIRFENHAAPMGKWFEVHAFRIGSEGSSEVGVLFKDITERRVAALVIEEERARQDRTLETAQVAVWRWEIEANRVYASKRLQFLFALSDEAAAGGPLEPFVKAMHVDDRARVGAAMQASIQTGIPYDVEYRVTGADGVERWVLARGNAEFGEDGKARALSGVLTDISDAKIAQATLRSSEERFRQLVDLSPSTVWFAEPDGGLSYISQEWYETTGLTPETALPHGWATTVHPDDLTAASAAWDSARRDETRYDTEFRIRLRSGEYRWISARAMPVRDADGVVTGWLGSNSDIQERKSIETTLQARVEERTRDLREAVKEAEAFNYSISHDLRTPLRAIVSTSRILLEEAGPALEEEYRELLDRQAHNAARLGTLIDELLRLSRLARAEIVRVPLDMTAKAQAVVEDLGTDCRFEIQEGMSAEGDAALVRTVFENLIGNACKFSRPGGVVRVAQSGDVFRVRDEGIGFDMRYAPKIFLPFERLVTEAEFPGTGIGLANVERIVRRHGGRVWAESAPGRGATFLFTLG